MEVWIYNKTAGRYSDHECMTFFLGKRFAVHPNHFCSHVCVCILSTSTISFVKQSKDQNI